MRIRTDRVYTADQETPVAFYWLDYKCGDFLWLNLMIIDTKFWKNREKQSI